MKNDTIAKSFLWAKLYSRTSDWRETYPTAFHIYCRNLKVNCRNSYGKTPLMLAAENAHHKVSRNLRKAHSRTNLITPSPCIIFLNSGSISCIGEGTKHARSRWGWLRQHTSCRAWWYSTAIQHSHWRGANEALGPSAWPFCIFQGNFTCFTCNVTSPVLLLCFIAVQHTLLKPIEMPIRTACTKHALFIPPLCNHRKDTIPVVINVFSNTLGNAHVSTISDASARKSGRLW